MKTPPMLIIQGVVAVGKSPANNGFNDGRYRGLKLQTDICEVAILTLGDELLGAS